MGRLSDVLVRAAEGGRKDLVLKGGTLVLPDRLVPNGTVVVSEGKILEIIEPSSGNGIGQERWAPGTGTWSRRGREPAGEASGEAVALDVSGCYVAPGLIDIHIHGGGGYGFDWDAPLEEWLLAMDVHLGRGVTGLLPTLPVPVGRTYRFQRIVRELLETDRGRAVLGFHFEGPWLSPVRRGAWEEDKLKVPQDCDFDEAIGQVNFVRKTMGMPCIVTLAPELPGAGMFARAMAERGVVVSMGHTDATFTEAVQAVSDGVRHATHLFNAMRPFHHREPGPVGAALESREVNVEIICDGMHVSPVAMRMVSKCKGIEGVVLITDASPLAGLPPGEVRRLRGTFNQFPVEEQGGSSRTLDGRLAGSVLTLDRAVANAVRFMGVSLQEAIRMASLTPARILGLDGRKGSLEEGKDADIVIMNRDYDVEVTLVGGKVLVPTI